MVQGISCAKYWSLILQYVYAKEGIEVPTDEEKAEFLKYHFPKEVKDDVEVFPNIARIPDAMLKRVDPVNPVLLEYLKSVNPDVQIGMLLSKIDEGPSKKSRKSKKDSKSTPEKPVQEPKPKKPLKKQSNEEEHVSLAETMVIEPNVVETEK